MTGIEAIANGVQVFQEPAPRNARKTLLVMGILLSGMFFAISGLGFMYGVAPSSDLTVIAQIGTRVFGPDSVLWGDANLHPVDLGAGGEYRLFRLPALGGDARRRPMPTAADALGGIASFTKNGLACCWA